MYYTPASYWRHNREQRMALLIVSDMVHSLSNHKCAQEARPVPTFYNFLASKRSCGRDEYVGRPEIWYIGTFPTSYSQGPETRKESRKVSHSLCLGEEGLNITYVILA